MSPHAIAALCAALIGLSGCDSAQIDTALKDMGDKGIGLAAFGGVESSSESSEPAPSIEAVIPPQPSSAASSGPCTDADTVFRIVTCDQGVLHHLGPNMEWID